MSALGAFGRLRVCNNFTLFDYFPTSNTSSANGYDQDVWVSTLGGSATQSYNSDNYVNMTVTTTGDYILRQTKIPMDYQPGKSRLMFFTGVILNGTVSGDTMTSQVGILIYLTAMAHLEKL